MVKEVRSLRLFVIAPDDVSREREQLLHVVGMVNRALSDRGVRIEPWHWRADLGPGLHAEGVRGLLSEELGEADIVVVVLWNAPGEAGDDVAETVTKIVARWRSSGSPVVLPFRCLRSATLGRAAKRAALVVDDIEEALAAEGLLKTFVESKDFENALFAALHSEAEKHATRSAEVATPHAAPDDVRLHVERIVSKHGAIDLTGLLVADRATPSIPLRDVYVDISMVRPPGSSVLTPEEEAERRAGAESLIALTEEALGTKIVRPSLDDTFGPLLDAIKQGIEATADVLVENESLGQQDWAIAMRPTALRNAKRLVDHQPRSVREVQELLDTFALDWVVQAFRHLLIEGDPGAGKTTALEYIAVRLAEAHLDPENSVSAQAMGFEPPFPLPVFTRLERFAAECDTRGSATGAELERFLCREHGEWLRRILEQGEAVVLLDGLDEIASETRRQWIAEVIRDFISARGENRFVVTTRPSGLSEEVHRKLIELGRLGHFRISPLMATEVRRFVRAWYRTLVQDQVLADTKAADLTQRIEENDRVSPLVTTPVLLTAVAIVHLNSGSLPERRAVLYEQCVHALAGRLDDRRGVEIGLEHDRRIRIFSQLAFEMHSKGEHRLERSVLLEWVREQLEAQEGRPPSETRVREVTTRLVERSGLLVHDGEVCYRFRHLTFQEFLAARWLATQAEDADAALAEHIGDREWGEVNVLLLGFLGRDGPAPAIRCLSRLVDHIEGLADIESRHPVAAILGRALVDLASYPEGERYRLVADRMTSHWIELLGVVDDQVSRNDRIAAGDAMGIFGDPRLSDAQRWVDVLGTDGSTEGFRVHRWPITVGEYSAFIDGGGYDQDELWDVDGWAWRQTDDIRAPWAWSKQRRFQNHGVVGVSWWEASAYARWFAAGGECGPALTRLPSLVELKLIRSQIQREAPARNVLEWLERLWTRPVDGAVGIDPNLNALYAGIWRTMGLFEWLIDSAEWMVSPGKYEAARHCVSGLTTFRSDVVALASTRDYRLGFRIVQPLQ